jgi:PPOX class probable F420-dependent enzyme
MTGTQARQRFAAARVARLSTVDASGRPHLVPIVFVLSASTVYTAVDAKPKRSTALRRLANIAVNPRVSVLVDHYSEDWTELWWVRADGAARLVPVTEPEGRTAIELLTGRYPRYREEPPPGPVIAIDVDNWAQWAAAAPAAPATP